MEKLIFRKTDNLDYYTPFVDGFRSLESNRDLDSIEKRCYKYEEK